jgi:hypothetical protein
VKLVKAVKGKRKGKATGPVVEQHPWPRRGRTWGTVVDGETYQLDGQPPPATTKGWGRVPGQDG